MSQEYVLGQVLNILNSKAEIDPSSDNTQIQKVQVPNETLSMSFGAQAFIQGASITESLNDTLSLSLSASASISNPANLVWGGLNGQGQPITTGWTWGSGGSWG